MGNYGRFNQSREASYVIDTLNLPVPWEFIYQNGRILLKVDQFGPVYAQADPPSDIMLFKRDPMQKYSSWLVWIKSPAFSKGPFCNFFRPNLLGGSPDVVPENLRITYSPEAAVYSFDYEGLSVRTELFCAFERAAAVMRLDVRNEREEPIPLSLIPSMLPYANPAVLAPWDKPEWYLKSGFGTGEQFAFWSQLLNMNSVKEDRRAIALLMDKEGVSSVELSYEHFAGQGTFSNPEAVFRSQLGKFASAGGTWGEYKNGNCIYGYAPVFAAQYDSILQPGETKTLTQVLSMADYAEGGLQVDPSAMRTGLRYFEAAACEEEKRRLRERFDRFFNLRRIETPDRELDRYVNEWLPLQMYWVASLDRGWPSGMRGSRDSANDFTAMVPLDGQWSGRILETLMSCQRSDGWFPRQYSALGRKGKHDLRGHVDAGAWVIELLYEYLCHTRDFEVLSKRLPWMDSDREDTVLCHCLKALGFYLREDHTGEHGLCKIGEGDWLDSVNRAGIAGRGESVMVTNQVIIALTYMLDIINLIKAGNTGVGTGNAGHGAGSAGAGAESIEALTGNVDAYGIDALEADTLIGLYSRKRQELKDNLKKHACNKEGYFNSVFNDDGKWLFSDEDPDGRKRIYGPANWYSVSSGAAVPEQVDSVLKTLEFLKCEMGYRLYWPPMGDIPLDKVGRSGSGDLPAGLWENGNAYNQGSHGFLGRALAVAGKGDLLYESLRYLLPYDQTKHPTEKTLTPPYAVVNCWQQVPGFVHRGGLSFLTGSIAMGLRMVYDWMLGIKPALDGLAIDPCIPSRFGSMKARFTYLGKAFKMEIENEAGRQTTPVTVLINGITVNRRKTDSFSGRSMYFIADTLLVDGENHIKVIL
jgi:hypothetical protein